MRAILQTIPDLVWLKDENGVFIACNKMFERFYGASESEIVGRTDYDFVPRELADSFRKHDLMAMRSGKTDISERWITFADDGHRIYIETIKAPMYDGEGRLIGVLGIARDITARRSDAARIHRLTQLYAALSQCNQAIVRSTSEAELFPQVCDDAVHFGGMRMAWIGILDQESGRVRPVAFSGEGSEYLADIEITVDGTLPSGRGPTGVAIRENRPFWCQDFQNDPATMAWHERAKRFGWASSASLPLVKKGIAVGAFTLYSKDVDAFDEPSRNLLLEMATDISFAMDNFESEAVRKSLELQSENERSVLELLARGESLPAMLDFLARSYETMYPGMYCSVLLASPDGKHLVKGAAPSLPDAYIGALDGMEIGEDSGSCSVAAFSREATIVEDIASDPQWRKYREIALSQGLASCWSIPILSTKEQVLGTFALYGSQPRAPKPLELAALGRGAHLASLAIERAQNEARIVQLAHFDALTGLPNLTLLKDRVAHAMGMAQRSGSQVALMFLDLDHFKNVNDTLGHRIGDELLVQLSRRLKSVLRDEDTLSRMGGDEFIFVLPGTDADGAAHVAEKLLETVASPYQIRQYELSVTPSVGIAIYPADGTDFDRLYQCADVAMYRAKRDGRNCFRFFTSEMQERSSRRMQLENALRQALMHDQFELYYQPQISIEDGSLVGAEALLRWQHPELGAISPAEFIPVAEESGLILGIGEWVLREAARQAKAWLGQGLELTIAVNLSAVQFRQANLSQKIMQILNEAQLPPRHIELELTESVAMEVPMAAIAVMDELHERGFRMSIDDFGTGYSSLSYLRKFKINKLKIDQSFVSSIFDDPESRAIVSAIITLADSLGFETIAEGVETEEQLEFLRMRGCREVQGYYFSKPLRVREFEAFVLTRR